LNAPSIDSIINYYSGFAQNGNYFVPLREALGDYGIKCGVALSAINALKGLNASVYNYFFTRNTENWRYTQLNATHTVEVPYVLLSNGTLFEAQFTEDEKQLARNIVRYITQFQTNNDPNIPKKNNLANWPVFNNNKASTLSWDVDLSTIKLPIPTGCQYFWDNSVSTPDARQVTDEDSIFTKFVFDADSIQLNLFH